MANVQRQGSRKCDTTASRHHKAPKGTKLGSRLTTTTTSTTSLITSKAARKNSRTRLLYSTLYSCRLTCLLSLSLLLQLPAVSPTFHLVLLSSFRCLCPAVCIRPALPRSANLPRHPITASPLLVSSFPARLGIGQAHHHASDDQEAQGRSASAQ